MTLARHPLGHFISQSSPPSEGHTKHVTWDAISTVTRVTAHPTGSAKKIGGVCRLPAHKDVHTISLSLARSAFQICPHDHVLRRVGHLVEELCDFGVIVPHAEMCQHKGRLRPFSYDFF